MNIILFFMDLIGGASKMRYVPITREEREYIENTGKTPPSVMAMTGGCSVKLSSEEDSVDEGPGRVEHETPYTLEFSRSRAEEYAHKVEDSFNLAVELFGRKKANESHGVIMGRRSAYAPTAKETRKRELRAAEQKGYRKAREIEALGWAVALRDK
jgi:hypothetical protein